MTKEQFKSIRKSLGLSANEMASALGLSDGRVIRGYESGRYNITGTVRKLLKYIEKYGIMGEGQ